MGEPTLGASSVAQMRMSDAGQYLLQSHFILQEIMVEVYEDGPSDRIRRKMESHG